MRHLRHEYRIRLVQRSASKDAAWFAAGKPSKVTRHPLWMRSVAALMATVMYFAPAVFLADATAYAAVIVDPRAPVPFQPTVTQGSTGAGIVNITAPNAQGLSVNQFQSLSVGAPGLVFNNSRMAGTSLIGGPVGANPNLVGRTASMILAQVTSTGAQYRSVLAGPVEVFGAPASLIIANPNGVSIPGGMQVTNASSLTLTTGVPQFVTGPGGVTTDYAGAGALAYDVRSGDIAINGAPGNDGTPGPGIDGTVGNLDLIAQTLSISAPLKADQRVNLIAGNQLVSPTATGAAGTSYGTASNGAANNAAVIQTPGGLAIDASQYGSVTSGQIYIVSTAAGMGVNTQGALAATAGNVTVNTNGDITAGNTFANQNVTLTSAGTTNVFGTGLANQNFTINANGDINATGPVSAGQNVSLNAGGDLNAASVAANGSADLIAGGSMSLGSLSAHDLDIEATNGNLTLGQAITAPGTIRAVAGLDLTVNGSVQGGGTVGLSATRNAAVNGTVTGVGDTSVTGITGTSNISGNVQTNGALTVSSAQGTTLGGIVQAQGPVSVIAQNGSITGQGDVASSQGSVSLDAGQAINLSGSVQVGGSITALAGGDALFGGTLAAPGAISVTTGGDATLGGNATSGSTLTIAAGANASILGTAASVGNMSLTAANGSLSTANNVVTLGTLAASGQQGVNLGGNVYSQGNAQISSGAGSVAVAGALSTPGSITVNAAQDVTVTGLLNSGGDATITATRDANLNVGLDVQGTGNATITVGRDINGSGAVNVANDTTLLAGSNIGISGAIQTGNNLAVTAGNNLAVGATTAVGNETLTATAGSATLASDALSGGDMAIRAAIDVTTPGSVQSLGNLNVNAQGGNLSASGRVSTAGTATLNAGQNLSLAGQTIVSGDATLTGANITTQGLAVGGNLTATAQNSLDTSAGQLNAAFDASAPALSVNGNATLTGANVTTANAVIGGIYSATGTTSIMTGGTAAYQSNATLAGGTVTNVGTQMAAGDLTVSGSTVTNQGALSSLQTAAVNATDLNNSGSIYGTAANLNVTNSTVNAGALLATNTLALTTASLDNSNGLIFAGDVNSPTSPVGDVTVNVNGGNGTFNNTNGQILAQNGLTLNLPNQVIDPSAATMGMLNGGSAFNLSAQSISNTGAWTLPGTAVTVIAAQGMSNTGTINQGAGTLALNGAVSNAGTIAAQDLTITGSLANQTGALVQANDAFTLNGSGTNMGTVQAVNSLTIAGSGYDNSNGITQAGNSSSAAGSGNVNISLSGDLTNAGGMLTATNDLSITANNVVNSGAGADPGVTTTTTTTVDNPGLALALVVGSDKIDEAATWGSGGVKFCCTVYGLGTNQVTLADALSVDGVADPTSINTILGPTAAAWKQFSPPVTNGNTVTFVEIPTVTGTSNTGNSIIQNLWFVQTPDNASQAIATITVVLPTATETTTTTGGTAGGTSVIAAGHNVSINASSLNNQGGKVSAGNDTSVNVQSLNNGGSVYTSTVTDTVDVASIDSFLSQAPSTISLWNTFNGPNGLEGCPFGMAGVCIDPSGIRLAAPGTVTPLSTSSSITVQGAAGQIVAGHDLNLSGGDLVNAGTLAATNDVNISAASFTNQGTSTGTMTTTAGCAAGFSAGCTTLSTTNPNAQTYSYQQINSNVTAGHDIVIAANTVSNTYGNLAAGNSVVIGGAGTTAAAPTQAASVTNTSGAIAAGNDVDINGATLVNTIAAPVQVHQNYGTATPFTGCTSNCEAYIDVQSATPATITANHNVNLTAGSFSNTGSLITALNNVTINATATAGSDNQYLNAYWASDLLHYNTSYVAWGCASNPSLCQTLYGNAYSSSAAQDPAGLPSSVGLPDFVPATIQAGNTLSVNSPTLTNTGNVVGQTVALSGSQLVNGLMDPDVYTPPPVVTGQVISLGPPAVPANVATTVNGSWQVTNANGQAVSVTGSAGLPSNSPIGVQTVGKPLAPLVSQAGAPAGSTVQTIAGQTIPVTYLVNSPASAVTGDLSPAALLAALPANLQPGTTQFYYDPYTQAQQVEQAALQATGKASFYSTTGATDSTGQASISNQDTQALYGAALRYAEQNNVALGTQLSAAQLAQINAPMLWYVEQSVPEPGCTVTGSGACPTVQALMPEVLLPQNYAEVSADGEISGANVALNYANSILNTGSISAQNLTVNTASLTNEERSTNIGTIYNNVDNGVAVTTGTLVQQGGFMSAMNYDLNAQTIDQIGGALQQINSDGSVNQAATSQMLANLKSQLGSNFTQSTVSNNLNTTVISDGGMGLMTVFEMAIIVAMSVVTAGAASAALAGMQVAAADAGMATLAAGGTIVEANAAAGILASSAFAAGGVANAAIAGAMAGLVGSAAGDLMSSGTLNFGDVLKGAAIGGLTAGLTDGITLDDSGIGFSLSGSPDSLASLAGVQSVGNSLVPQAGASTAGSLPEQALALAGEATVQAGVQTAIDGGSFLASLRNSAVSDVAAAGAYAIGNANLEGDFGTGTQQELEYVAAHAALGCAASAAEGTGCVGGAIGGAVSAALSPSFIGLIDPVANPLDSGQLAALAAFATLAGGGLAALAGVNVQGAATAAQNEALNNSSVHIGDGKSETQKELDELRAQQAKEKAALSEATGGQVTDNSAATVPGSSLTAGLGGATNNAPLGLGSTGRAVSNNLQEQLALQQAMSNPAAGVQLPIPLGDSRWPAADGWVKMSQNVNGVEIHYVRNVNSGAVDDFKFK
ncbi:Filamentous haemagglutinin family outer membrane protein [Paraburkholderia ribeironis]|uniref:Filamentous haemagglutinin family outer membrane protein n=1 Tax=Paraburkholderia ribeironis TaxID=1247936 RepID=A0A1N7RKC3_9BURK|nr:filamentous hemagglutinin [Paraburkholderia ribeironis]SIT35568.1 Filamentous haemagglutinin family outer membrane protein [Paraburkholderia ribeironis]